MMDAVGLLQEIVAIPSLSGAEEAVAQHLVACMNELGLVAHIDGAGNAVGIRECPHDDGGFDMEILLLGHMDTVPGEIPVRVEEGLLYGRGAVDAKGPLATFVMAATQADLSPGTRVVVVGAVEEEAATSKGARFVANAFQPDLCIIGEPSGWNAVTLGYKGRLLLDADFVCPMSHTAGSERGAAEMAVVFWNVIEAFAADFNHSRKRLFDQLLPSLRAIRTDSDGLTNRASLQIGIRLPLEFDVLGFRRWAEEQAGGARIRWYAHEHAYLSDGRNMLGRSFRVVLRAAGVRPRYKLKTGTSDMNVVGPIWNCPIVAYGPGDSSLDHTPNEHIVLDEYVRAIGVLVNVLESLSL
jgi:LysW-gamma-L-lysine carboxypeptidase